MGQGSATCSSSAPLQWLLLVSEKKKTTKKRKKRANNVKIHTKKTYNPSEYAESTMPGQYVALFLKGRRRAEEDLEPCVLTWHCEGS